MTKVKKLNDASIPRRTEIADDALVTVTDKTTGAISNIEYGKLKELMFKNFSNRNLIANSGVESPIITYTKSKEYSLVEPLKDGKKYVLTICASGTSMTVRPVVGESNPSDDLFEPNTISVNGERIICSRKITNPLNATKIRFWSGSNDLVVHWCTLVEGDIPLTVWSPAVEDLRLGGGKSRPISVLRDKQHVFTLNRRHGERSVA